MTLKEIQKNLLKTERTVAMDQELKEIKKYKDFNEYYQAIRRANARKPKKPLKIHGNNFNLITSQKKIKSTYQNSSKNCFHQK